MFTPNNYLFIYKYNVRVKQSARDLIEFYCLAVTFN